VGSADKLAPTGVLKHFRAFSLCSVERQGRSMPSALDELGSSMLDSVSVLFTDGIRRLALDDDCAGTETTNKDKGGCSTKDHTVPPPSKPAHRHEDKKQGSAAVLTAAGASASKQGPRRGHRRNYSGSWGQFVGFDEDGNLEPVPRSKGQGSRGFASRRYRYNPRSKSAQVVAGGARSTDQDAQSAQDDDSVGVKTWRNLRRAVFRSFLACSFAPTFDVSPCSCVLSWVRGACRVRDRGGAVEHTAHHQPRSRVRRTVHRRSEGRQRCPVPCPAICAVAWL